MSDHAHVLLCIAKEPEVLLREVAHRVGITERPSSGSWLTSGREVTARDRARGRNRYEVHLDRPMRHSVESHREVGVLLNLVLGPDQPDLRYPES